MKVKSTADSDINTCVSSCGTDGKNVWYESTSDYICSTVATCDTT